MRTMQMNTHLPLLSKQVTTVSTYEVLRSREVDYFYPRSRRLRLFSNRQPDDAPEASTDFIGRQVRRRFQLHSHLKHRYGHFKIGPTGNPETEGVFTTSIPATRGTAG